MSAKTFNTYSFEETQQLGKQFAETLQGGEVLCLYGDLGSGKTTFVQGMADGLGINRRIISPTFIIMRTYDIQCKTQSAKPKTFYHVDLYRIETVHDIEGLGLLDLLGKPDTIVAIEWPEKFGKLLPKQRIDLKFQYIDENNRKIMIER